MMNRTLKTVFFTLLASLLLSVNVFAQDLPTIPRNPERPTVAVVLSGGGAKGFTHVGVLKVLEEEGIPIDLIVGTSMGSLVGGLYCTGYSADSLLYLMHQQNWDTLISDMVSRKHLTTIDREMQQRYLISIPIKEKRLIVPQGAMKGQNVINLFSGFTANFPSNGDFMKLSIPFASVTADITSGDEVVFTSGSLPFAMYSSMAVPGVFDPARIDNRVLVDGGVVNNFPVDVAKNMGADIIIGVDLRDDYSSAEDINTVGDVVWNLINIYSKAKDIYLPLCDVRIFPDVSGYHSASFNSEACDTLYERGIIAAQEKIDEIRAVKKKLKSAELQKTSTKYVQQNKWLITDVKFNSDKKYNEEFLLKIIDLPLNESYDYDEIKQSIDRLYGLGSFKNIFFSLENNTDGRTLILNLESQSTKQQSIGFRVNTTDMAALLINHTWRDYARSLGFVSLSVELSANPGFQAVVETNWHNFPNLGFKYNIKYQDFAIYDDGKKIVKSDLLYTYGKTYLEQRFNFSKMGISLQEEYFQGNTPTFERFLLTGASAYIALDNLDDFYFPSSGSNSSIDLTFDFDNLDEGHFSSYLSASSENWIPVNDRLTLEANIYGRIVLSKECPAIKRTIVGGESYSRYLPYHFPFLGMPPVSYTENYMGIASLGLRFKVMKSHFFTLQFNTLQQGHENILFLTNRAVYGGGLKYAIKTPIGPIDVALGVSNYQNRPSFSANLGLWF